MLLDVINEPPLCGLVAVAALPVVFWFSVGKVQLAKLPDDGVPKAGVTKVGLFDKTTLPEPVEDVTPVPPLDAGSVPVVPPSIGKPVAFVNVAEEGVPKAGVTNVGLVANTRAPEPVSPVTAAAKFELEGVAKNVATPEPRPEMPVSTGNPVQLVNVPEDGVPSAGVVIVGLANVGEMRCVFCWATFVPSLHTVIVLSAGMATVVPPGCGVVPFLAVAL